MLARADAVLNECSCRRLAKIVTQRREHHGYLFSVRQIVDERAGAIDCQERVNPNVAFRMPFRFLRHIDQSFQLGKQLIDDTKIAKPLQPDGWALRP